MNLAEFKERYQVKDRADGCDDRIIVGRLVDDRDRPENHHHVFEVAGAFQVYFNLPTKARWNSIQKRLLAAGGWRSLSGDCDGFIAFDPTNEPLVKLILKLAGIRVKRKLSEEQRAKLRERLVRS